MENTFSKLKLSRTYLNPYEQAHDLYKSHKFFNESDWNKAIETDTLDQYVDALSKSTNIKYSDLRKTYNLDFADDDTRLAALYNEIYADRALKSREIDEYDNDGNIIGKKTIQISDYDYYKNSIQYHNQVNMQNFYADMARAEKEAMSGWDKFLGWIGSAVGTFVTAPFTAADDITELLGSTLDASLQAIQGKDWAESFGAALSSDQYRAYEFDKDLLEYEMKYGWRDAVTGEYTSDVNAIIAGTLDTVGKMLPSAYIGKAAGVVTGTSKMLLKPAVINTTVQQAVSMGTFYAATEFGQSYERSYEYAKDNDLTVDYSHMLLTDALSTGAKAAISIGMNKLFGGTALERFMYGTPGKGASTGKISSLWVKSIFNAAGDALQEGTEEVLQDVIDALVHDMMGSDYAGLSTLSIEDLTLTFLTAALAGVVGTAGSIIKTKKINVAIDGKMQTLSKASSYILALRFNNLQQQVDDVMNYISKQNSNIHDKTVDQKYDSISKKYKKSFRNIYTSAKAIGTLFNSIGEERVNNVMAALTRINNAIESGKFDDAQMTREAKAMAAEILGDMHKSNIISASAEKLANDIKEAGLNDIAYRIHRGDNIDELDGLSDAQRLEMKKLLASDKNIQQVIITKDGHSVVTNTVDNDTTIATPIELTKNANDILKFAAGKRLVHAIRDNPKFKREAAKIKNLYIAYSGQKNVGDNQVVSALLSDSAFFEVVLFNSNSDAYEILSQLGDMADASLEKSQSNQLYIKAINNAKASMRIALLEYLSYQTNADVNLVPKGVISDEDVAYIRKIRYSNDLRARSISGQTLTENEMKFITKKINAMPLANAYKQIHLKNIFSESIISRTSAWKAIDVVYSNIFNSKYDGKTYMPKNSVPNHTFNTWLQINDLTIDTLMSRKLTTAETQFCLDTYKNTDQHSILKMRQLSFEQYTHDAYTFKYDESGKLGIFNLQDNTQVGWSLLLQDIKQQIAKQDLSDKSVVLTNRHNKDIITSLCNEKLSTIAKAAITINDLVTNPSLLSEKVITEMQNEDYTTSVEDTFAFLQHKLKSKTRGKVTVTVLANGTYALAEITKMTALAISNKAFDKAIASLKTDGFVAASDFIKKKYVFDPKLEKIFFKLSSADKTSSDYLPPTTGGAVKYGENKILINRNMINDPHLKYTLLHEYTHQLQDVNGQNCGFNPHHFLDLYKSGKLTKATAKLLINDVREHVPEIFNTIDKQAKLAEQTGILKKDAMFLDELRIISEFVYYTCGELNAFGLENDIGLLYYPVVVNYDSIIFPWGKVYKYDTAEVMHFQLEKIGNKYIRTDIGKYVGDEYDISNVTKYNNFLEILNDPAYEDSMQLYYYLKSKTSDDSTFLSDNNYRNLYIENYPQWAKLYNERFDKFTSMNSATAIAAYKSIEMNNSTDLDKSKIIKDNLKAAITAEDRITSLRLLHTQIAPTLSFEEFLELELPYVRVQQNEDLYDTDFVSLSVGSFGTASFGQILYEDLFSKHYNYAYVGVIKPSQLMCYIDPDTFEAIANPNDLIGAERYLVDIREDGIYVLDNFTSTVETIKSKERQNIDRISYFALNAKKRSEFGGPRPAKYADETKYEEVDESEYPSEAKANYKHRRAFKSLKTGKVYFQYYGQKEVKKRQISSTYAADTNLKAYVNQRISPNFQSFIKHATLENAGKYYDKILDGSLREKDIIRDFRQGKITDPKIFKLVNESFFKNEYIKTPAQLEDMIDNADVYYALPKLLRQYNFNPEEIDAMSIDTAKAMLNVISTNSTLQNLLDKLRSRYTLVGAKDKVIEPDPAYLRMSFMKKFDGTAVSAKAITSLVRSVAAAGYISAGVNNVDQIATQSLNATYAEGSELGDAIGSDKYDIDRMLDADRDEKIQSILTAKLTMIYNSATKMSKQQLQVLRQKYDEWAKKVKKSSDEVLDKLYVKYFLSDIKYTDIQSDIAVNIETEATAEMTADEIIVNSIIAKSKADVKNIVRGISHQISTIKRNLRPKEYSRFLTDNSDIFNDDLTLKENVLHNTDSAGRLIYKSVEEIDAVKMRIHKLSKDVRGQVYSSKKAFDYTKKLERDIKKLQRKTAEALSNGSKRNSYTTLEIVEQDRSLTVDTSKTVPEKLKPLLNYVLSKKADTNVQYLTDDNTKHVQVSLKNFVSDNAEYLSTLTQSDIDDIVDFYLTAEIIPSTNDAAKFTGIQIMTLSYILKGVQDGLYVFDSSVIENIKRRLETIVSNAGTQLDTWKTAMKMFRPAEQLVAAFYTQYGVKITTEQLQKITNAYNRHDADALVKVRQEVYDDMIKQNSRKYNKTAERKLFKEQKALQQLGVEQNEIHQRVDSIFTKVWNVERAFMLSGPGTAIRNWVSNTLIGGLYVKDKQLLPGLNEIAGKIGKFVVDKTLPKKWQKEKQWSIIGTKVDKTTQEFVKRNLLDTGLLTMIGDSLNKYDMRKFKKTTSTSDVFAELITRKLAQDVFNNNHKIAAFFAKWLSDDKAVSRATLRYYGKLLTEDKTTITDNNGQVLSTMNERSTELLVEAYVLAANDFMHKSNFIHKIEEVIKTKGGNTTYFIWKQFFPFAASSVNWYVESLRYTPLGLIQSIRNFAKLEKEIDRLTDARQKGETVISSKFAQYVATRNIGKGVIGTIGTLIGAILAITGAVKLDEDDEKYKLTVGNISVDITELFGTQGILMGMGITQGIIDSKDPWSIVRQTGNTLFEDSLYTSVLNMFKYGSDTPMDNIANYITYTIPNMFIPNLLKTVSAIARENNVKYDSGLLGKIEKMIVNAIPFIDRAFPTSYDPYTGDKVMKYTFSNYFIEALNKLGVLKFKQYDISATEALAISLGVHKGELTGKYQVSNEKIELSNLEISDANKFYGSLNKKDLADFTNDSKKYKVLNENGKYVELRYSQMTDEQKATIINRIMDNNSSLAKIYILTSTNRYKYYATDNEYKELKQLGITKNIYRKTNKLDGFVKIN